VLPGALLRTLLLPGAGCTVLQLHRADPRWPDYEAFPERRQRSWGWSWSCRCTRSCNHVADLVARYGASSEVPTALTDYIKGREGYDYNQHGQAGNVHTQFVPDEIVDRFCILGGVDEHVRRIQQLKELGVDQFAVYLQHDDKDGTLRLYGEKVIPAIADSVLATS
jgi:hypothetical protein